jgi:hypothetical protein
VWQFIARFDAPPQKQPTCDLKLGGRVFPVKRAVLCSKLRLFRYNPSLLYSDYEVHSKVPLEIFNDFVSALSDRSPTFSNKNCDFFRQLAKEFQFGELSVECDRFTAQRRPGSAIELVVYEEVKVGPGHRVTMTAKESSRTYESLHSLEEIRDFGSDLKGAKSIVIDRIEGNDRVVEKAVAAVYSNSVADMCDSDARSAFWF